MRLGERLKVEWHVENMPRDALVPPLVLQPLLAGFLEANPGVHIELTNDEGYVDIVEQAPEPPNTGGDGADHALVE